MRHTIDETDMVRQEGNAVGIEVMDIPLFNGGSNVSTRGIQIVIGTLEIPGSAPCGVIAITDEPGVPGMHVALPPDEMRAVGAEIVRIANEIEGGSLQ